MSAVKNTQLTRVPRLKLEILPVGQRLVVLDGLLHVLGLILVEVVVRPDRLLQLVVHHLSGALGTHGIDYMCCYLQ